MAEINTYLGESNFNPVYDGVTSYEFAPLDISGSVPASSSPTGRTQINTIGGLSKPSMLQGSSPKRSSRVVSPNIIGGLNDTAESNVAGTPDSKTPEERQAGALESIADDRESLAASRQSLAGAKFLLDFMNANSAYAGKAGAAFLNTQNARMQARDAIRRGQQRSLEERELGIDRGDKAALALASQGQDVGGAHVESLRASYETIGIFNGLQEETNSIREALGFDLEEVNIDYELAQSRIQRDNTIISSALQYGASFGNANSDYGIV